jgi:uncharacterized protein
LAKARFNHAMDIKIDKRFELAASAAQAWTVLADVHAVAACMPGAAITETVDATHFKGQVKSKVGPAVMSFAGTIEVLQLDAPTRTLQMLGKGADRGGSSAMMDLTARIEAGANAASSVLVGQATVSVSGKLAQFGSRLLVPVSDAMLDQFAANFAAAAAAVASAAGNAPDTPAPPVPAAPSELNALALMWTVFKAWLARLFGRA